MAESTDLAERRTRQQIFAALGDSITLGIGDPVPGGRRGWAAILASALPDTALVNLAASGARFADVERGQLPAALRLRPTLASVVVGVNDMLRRDFCPIAIATSAAHTVGALRAAGAQVLTMRLPDPGRMFGLPAALAQPLASRIHVVNGVVDDIAERFGTIHLDMANHAEAYRPDMWGVDRLHPSERGHRLLASAYFELLQMPGTPPSREPDGIPPRRMGQLWWLGTRGVAWLIRRSVDLVPYLIWMAGRTIAYDAKRRCGFHGGRTRNGVSAQ